MTTVSQVQVHANPKAAWELIGILENEVSERDALIAAQSAALAMAEGALRAAHKSLSETKLREGGNFWDGHGLLLDDAILKVMPALAAIAKLKGTGEKG